LFRLTQMVPITGMRQWTAQEVGLGCGHRGSLRLDLTRESARNHRVFPARELIRQWLKAGYVEMGTLHPTETGALQGGVISPSLMNIALHGMEEALGVRYDRRGQIKGSRVLVRYADDWVMFCESKEESTYSRDKYLIINHIKPALGRLKLTNLNALHIQALYRDVRVRRTLTRKGTGYVLGEPKTKHSRRTVRLTQRAVEALRSPRARQAEEKLKAGALYQDQGLVFASEGGGLINPSNLRQRSLALLLKRAGLPQITFHDLRHTCASLLFQRNIHPKLVQDLLGHASVAITLNTYSHMLPGMGSEAADAMGEALARIIHEAELR
jgi:hypothetical protein